jgi:hypothetical protein
VRPRSRKTLARPESLEGILDRAGENRFAQVRPPVAPGVWKQAVGARIAEKAQPVSLSAGVLLLRVPSSVWAHELSMLAGELCARLQERGVDARELRFRVGSLPGVDRPPERRSVRAVPPAKPIPGEVMRPLAGVRDEKLRETIARAISANLAWQSAVRPSPEPEVCGAQRAARAPRDAAPGSARPDPASTASREARRRNHATGRDRPR